MTSEIGIKIGIIFGYIIAVVFAIVFIYMASRYWVGSFTRPKWLKNRNCQICPLLGLKPVHKANFTRTYAGRRFYLCKRCSLYGAAIEDYAKRLNRESKKTKSRRRRK
jgi:hypothetical protein